MKNQTLFLFTTIAAFLSPGSALAQQPDRIPGSESSCVSAKVTSGKSCTDIIVELDLRECTEEQGLTVVKANITKCKSNSAVAEFKSKNFLYRAKIAREEGAWGTGEFKLVGSVKRTQLIEKKPAPSDQPADSKKTAEPVLVPIVEKPLDTGIVLGGFIDANFQMRNDPVQTKGFNVNDGAIYISKDNEVSGFKIDLPFNLTSAANSNFNFANTKAQAYLVWRPLANLKFKLGQFDTSFGFEGNDTVDIFFTRQGNIYNATDPFVHTGLVTTLDLSKVHYINLYTANPKDTGLITGKNPELGLQLVSTDDIRTSLGLLMTKGANRWNQYYDFTIGTTLGFWNFDFEINHNKKDLIADSTGYLAHIVFQPSQKFSYGVRAEYIENLASSWRGDANVYRQILIYAGPQFAITDNFKLKTDYSYEQNEVLKGSTPIKGHAGSFSLVYRL